jgi:hypothetical protein
MKLNLFTIPGAPVQQGGAARNSNIILEGGRVAGAYKFDGEINHFES